MNKLTTQQKHNIAEFVSLVRTGIEAWVAAGKLLVTLQQEDNQIFDKIVESEPSITHDTLSTFVRVGKGYIYAPLLVHKGPGPNRLLTLPYEEQVKYATEPVGLLVNNTGAWETLKVAVKNLTKDQVQQVFSPAGIRDESAQRAWLEDRKSKLTRRDNRRSSAGLSPYQIRAGKVEFLVPGTYGKKELTAIMARL